MSPRRLSICLATALLAAAGCRVTAPASRMGELRVDIPGTWAATREGRAGVDTDWVPHMGSPRLEALVREALAHNPDLKIAAARVEQARTFVKAAGAQRQPKLDMEGTGTKSERNFVGFPFGDGGVLSLNTEMYSLNFLANWEVDLWGRIRASVSAAAAATQAAELDARAARSLVAAQTVRAWFALLEANEQADLAQQAIAAAEDTEKSLEERFRTGQAGDQSGLGAQLRLARSDIQSAKSALEARKEAQGQSARALELLLGRYPQGDRRTADRLPALTSPPPPGLPSEILQRRPDILAAERRFAAQGMREKVALRALFPSFKLTGTLGSNTDNISRLLSSDFGVWSLGTNVSQPILTGGAALAEIRNRRGQQGEALATLQKTVLHAFGEVENALEAEAFLRRREEFLSEAVRLATEADAEARANFRQGLGDILTVLTTQQRAIQARSSLAALRRLRLDNRVSLHLAIGGDFQVREK